MKNISILSLIILVVFIVSCKKILTVDQKMNIPNEHAITTVKDLEAAMSGVYDKLQSGNVLGGNLVVYADLLADDTQVNEAKLYAFGTSEIYHHQTTMQINALRDMWRDSYSAINMANNVIRVIDENTISGADYDAKKDKLKGEALFIRAIIHFELLRFWALPYNVNTPGANLQLGIPYRTTPTLSGFADLAMARNTVEEVYNNVIADLQEAETLLLSTTTTSNTDASRSRPSAYACLAYLARVYFQKGDYNDAKFYAKKIIDKTGSPSIDNYSLNADPALVFKQSGNNYSSEGIFQLVNIAADQSNAIVGNYFPVGSDVQLFGCSNDLKNWFSVKDLRRSKYITVNPYNFIISPKKYWPNNPAYNVVLIRSAEMYLIHAESCALTGDESLAITSYKALKQKRFGTNWVDEVTVPSLLDSIRLERRREMIFEGDRLHTLKRLQQPLRNGTAWNDPSVLFKIPQEEMAGNPLMIQNP